VTLAGRCVLLPFAQRRVSLSTPTPPTTSFLSKRTPVLNSPPDPEMWACRWGSSEPRHEFAFSYYAAEGKFVYGFQHLQVDKQVMREKFDHEECLLSRGSLLRAGTLRSVVAHRSLLKCRTSGRVGPREGGGPDHQTTLQEQGNTQIRCVATTTVGPRFGHSRNWNVGCGPLPRPQRLRRSNPRCSQLHIGRK
jgi:hypothetical protein